LLTLREVCRLRLFKKGVQRKIFGLKRDVVSGELRRLHTEELDYLYSAPYIIRVIKSLRMR